VPKVSSRIFAGDLNTKLESPSQAFFSFVARFGSQVGTNDVGLRFNLRLRMSKTTSEIFLKSITFQL
jgi:hypothetical protein